MKTYKYAFIESQANCYLSLALLADFDQVPDGEKEQILTQVHDNQETLEKLARCAPSNYLHKYHLVEAERMRVLEGEPDTIMHHYDQAIALARESEFIHEKPWPMSWLPGTCSARGRTSPPALTCAQQWSSTKPGGQNERSRILSLDIPVDCR